MPFLGEQTCGAARERVRVKDSLSARTRPDEASSGSILGDAAFPVAEESHRPRSFCSLPRSSSIALFGGAKKHKEAHGTRSHPLTWGWTGGTPSTPLHAPRAGSSLTGRRGKRVKRPGCILSMYAQLLVQDPVDTDLHARAEPKARRESECVSSSPSHT